MFKKFFVLVLALLIISPDAFAAKKAKSGDKVSTLYVGKLKDGRVFE